MLLEAAKSFQVITIYGSRQVGKTTTTDHLFGNDFDFVTLDDADDLNLALSSPKVFFETFVVSEIVKSFYNSGIDPKQYIYYYRDIDKKEVEVLFVKDGVIYPVEIKKGISPNRPAKNFKVLEKYGAPIGRGMVIENTEQIQAINDQAFSFPISLLGI